MLDLIAASMDAAKGRWEAGKETVMEAGGPAFYRGLPYRAVRDDQPQIPENK